jgi:vitamin B12 transporter
MKRFLACSTSIISLFAANQATALEEIVVSATRSPQLLYRIGSSVTVLSSEVIKSSQTVVISDLLGQTPGVNVTRNGGVGGATSLRIRGAETDQTVVLIDGVKLNDPSAVGGGYNFANLLAGDIGRIEVLRGAQSTLWGSQAIGGVVSIQTAVPTKPFEASLEAEGGARATGSLKGAAGGAVERVTWRLAASQYTTDGISAFARGREDDGYRNTGASGRLNVELADNVSLDARAVYSKGRNGFDGFPAPLFAFADTKEYGFTEEVVGYTGLNVGLFDGKLDSRLAYTLTDTNRDNFNPNQAVTTRTFDAAGKNKRWEYQGTLMVMDGVSAVFGLENERSSLRTTSPSAFNPTPVPVRSKVELTSGYAQLQAEAASGLTLTAGLRHDDHDTFGNKTLGQAAAALALNDGATILRASFGQGFKAPTLFQLYSNFGNLSLKPEQADSWDAGVEHNFNESLMVSAIGFARKTKNQIDFAGCPGNPFCRPATFGVYDNIARTKAKGLELAAMAKLDAFSAQANYTYTDTENTSPGNINRGKVLARRPKTTANLWLNYLWPMEVSTGLGVRHIGKSFDNAANSFRLEDYTVVDLRASWPVSDTVELYGRIENLFDKTYVTVRDYGAPGRGAFGGIRARF